MYSLKDRNKDYTNLDKIKNEVEEAKNIFKKFKWPTIDVTRKSVEETAASIIKIHEIYLRRKMDKNYIGQKVKLEKEILEKNNIEFEIQPSNIDEEVVKKSLENKMQLQKLSQKILRTQIK